MFYNIYRDNISIAQIEPLDSSELSQQKQLEDLINLNFCSNAIINLQIGDYIISDKTEQKYILNKLPIVKEGGLFEYECVFEGSIHELEKTKVLLASDFNFPLTGNAQTFLLFMVENLNRNGGSYIVGKYATTDDLTVDFANWNVFEAITELSTLLDFDWYLDGLTLNFDTKDYETPYVLHVGLKSGFTKLTRTTVESTKIETIVYGYGSTDNLPPRTGDLSYNSPLLTENRLFFSGVDGKSKLENNVSELGKIESIQVFDDIKPERTGIITGIDTEDEKVFFDTAIDFDINDQKMEGIKPKIKFISGKLLGLQFNISYEHLTNKITMDLFTDESGIYPNETIRPEIGDEYKLFDLIMPQSYITDAETRLEAATQTYLDEHSISMTIFEGLIDNEWIQANDVDLDIGDIIRAISDSFAIDNYYEIKVLTQKITKPNDYTIQFGDILPKGLQTILQELEFNTQQSIYNVSSSQITNNEVTNIIGDENSWL